MTALVYPPLHENMTAGEHRQATVRWARRALRPDAAVIIGLGTTAPGSGSLSGKVGYSNLLNTGSLRTASITEIPVAIHLGSAACPAL